MFRRFALALLASTVLTAPAYAGHNEPVSQAQLPLVPFGATPQGGCDTSQYPSFIGGTASPQFGCAATKMAASPTIPFPAVVGINSPSGNPNDPTHLQYAQQLIQSQTAMDNTHQESALVVNFISKTGAGSQSSPTGAFGEKVGFYAPCLMMPGAGNTWCENPDLVVLAGVGPYNAYLRESDLTNFNGDYGPNGYLGTMTGDFKTFTGFPVTSGETWGGSTPYNGTSAQPYGVMKADIVNGQNYVTLDSDSQSVSVGDMVSGTGIPAFTYVGSIGSAPASPPTAAMAVTNAIGAGTKVYLVNSAGGSVNATATGTEGSFQIQTFNMHVAMTYSGTNLVRDNLFVDGTNDTTTLKLFGKHFSVVDTSSGAPSVQYMWTGSAGQQFCYAGVDFCWADNGGAMSYAQGGYNALTIFGGNPNGVAISAAGTGYGPILQSQGPAANIPLNLSGKGSGGVFSLSAFTAPGFTETLTTPSSSSATCTAGQFTDDANYHYVCVAANTWKRVALSAF